MNDVMKNNHIMKKAPIAIALLFLTLFVTAQEQSYTYTRKTGFIKLTTKSDTIILKDYISKKKERTRNREATIGAETFTLSIAKTKNGMVQFFINAQGEKQATMLLGNKNRYDITLADGTMLDCNITGRKWTYKKDTKEVLLGSIKRVEGKKTIIVNILDPQIATPAVLLSCLERGTDKYVSAAQTGPMIFTGVLLAIIGVATSSNKDPDY